MNKNRHCRDTLCANFQPNWTTLTFLAQICPKRKLGFEIQKTNVGIRISIFEICVPIFRQNEQLWPFGPKNFKNLSLDSESASLRYYVYQFTDIRDNFEFLGPNLPKNGFLDRNFKNLSLDSESGSLRYYVYQFSDKMDKFKFLCSNLPKNGFWGWNFKNLKSRFGIRILEILGTPIFRQNRQFWIFGPKFAQNGFWSPNFKNLSLDSESAPPIYHKCRFAVEMDNF